jgi:hypothetical protein
LIAAITQAAAQLAVTAPSLNTPGKTYEAWLMFDLAKALCGHAAQVLAKGHDEQPAIDFYLRGSPGDIPSAASTDPEGPCHFEIVCHGGERYELHASILHQGGGTTHELDLSLVLWHHANERRRRYGGLPYEGRRIWAAELKNYASGTVLKKNIARALLAVAVDLDPGVAGPVLRVETRDGKQVLGGSFTHPHYWLITSATLSQPSRDFLKHYSIGCETDVLPGTTTAYTAITNILNAVKPHF